MGVTSRESLERVAQLVDFPAFRRRQAEARAQGRYLGIGVATFIEAAPGPRDMAQALGFGLGKERAHVRMEFDGHLTVITAQRTERGEGKP